MFPECFLIYAVSSQSLHFYDNQMSFIFVLQEATPFSLKVMCKPLENVAAHWWSTCRFLMRHFLFGVAFS